MMCLPGVLAIGIALDHRRSAIRAPLIAQGSRSSRCWWRCGPAGEDLTGPPASVAITLIVVAGSLLFTASLLVAYREPAEADQRSGSTALALPDDVAAVLREFYTCELSTVNSAGRADRVAGRRLSSDEDAGRIVCAVSIAFPVKAYNARRHPQVSLLYSDPTGSLLGRPPAVLVQGTCAVDEVLDYTPDIIGLFRTVARRQPDSRRFSSNRVIRRLFSWYLFQRIARRVMPRAASTAWPGDSRAPPYRGGAVDGDGPPRRVADYPTAG